jgi:hypothetical protein
MIGGVLAIGDFMLILVTSALWVGAGVLAVGLLGAGTVGGMVLAVRRWWRVR